MFSNMWIQKSEENGLSVGPIVHSSYTYHVNMLAAELSHRRREAMCLVAVATNTPGRHHTAPSPFCMHAYAPAHHSIFHPTQTSPVDFHRRRAFAEWYDTQDTLAFYAGDRHGASAFDRPLACAFSGTAR